MSAASSSCRPSPPPPAGPPMPGPMPPPGPPPPPPLLLPIILTSRRLAALAAGEAGKIRRVRITQIAETEGDGQQLTVGEHPPPATLEAAIGVSDDEGSSFDRRGEGATWDAGHNWINRPHLGHTTFREAHIWPEIRGDRSPITSPRPVRPRFIHSHRALVLATRSRGRRPRQRQRRAKR